MATVISKRLHYFIGNHMEYEDIGDPENGPKLDSWYAGPSWAVDSVERLDNPKGFINEVNYFFGMEDFLGMGE